MIGFDDAGTGNGEGLFPLGRIVETPGGLAVLRPEDILLGLNQRASGDWGEVTAADKEANNRAVREGGRILSVYLGAEGVRFWVVTEADRSMTTVLSPQEP